MTAEEYADWVSQYASSIGLDPRVAKSVWQQESGGSLDTTKKGPELSRGRGNAIGPWQVVPSMHPNFPVEGDPVEQGKYAMNYLKEVGPARYYGTGQVMPGQPTTEEYVAQVMARAGRPDVRQASADGGVSTDTDRTPSGDPRTGRMNTGSALDLALLAQMGILPQNQQYESRNPFPLPQPAEKSNPLLVAAAGLAAGLAGGGGVQGALEGLGYAGQAMTDANKQDLVSQHAMAEQWRLGEELDQRRFNRQNQAKSGIPPNIQEMMILKQMYPDMSDSDIMSMAFAGRVPPGGAKVEKVGDRLFNVSYDQMGRPNYSPLSPDEQSEYEKTIGSQKKVEQIGQSFGKAHVDTLVNTSGEYQKAQSALNTTENVLKRFESGEFDGSTGPIAGRLGQYFDPKTAQIQAMEMSAALANLGIQNLAPVSNYEIDLIKKMDVSSFSNKAQNVAVLRDLVKVRAAKAEALKKALTRLKTESIEEYMANPETINYSPSAPSGGGQPSPAESGGWTIKEK